MKWRVLSVTHTRPRVWACPAINGSMRPIKSQLGGLAVAGLTDAPPDFGRADRREGQRSARGEKDLFPDSLASQFTLQQGYQHAGVEQIAHQRLYLAPKSNGPSWASASTASWRAFPRWRCDGSSRSPCVGHFLMRFDDDVPAGSRGEIADDSCFNVDPSIHGSSLVESAGFTRPTPQSPSGTTR